MKRLLTSIVALIIVFSLIVSVNAAEELYPTWGGYGKRDNVYSQVSTEEMAVALTFDDGPHPTYTSEILDILKEYGIKATFFVIGKNVELYGSSFRRCIAEGHEIGNHTYSHASAKTCSTEKLKGEIEKTNQLIQSVTVKKPDLFRPPTGLCNQRSVFLLRELGFKTIVWNIDTRDWAHTSVEKIVRSVNGSIKSGSIILFHDYVDPPSPTPDALRIIIPNLISKGYTFMTVNELLELDA